MNKEFTKNFLEKLIEYVKETNVDDFLIETDFVEEEINIQHEVYKINPQYTNKIKQFIKSNKI